MNEEVLSWEGLLFLSNMVVSRGGFQVPKRELSIPFLPDFSTAYWCCLINGNDFVAPPAFGHWDTRLDYQRDWPKVPCKVLTLGNFSLCLRPDGLKR